MHRLFFKYNEFDTLDGEKMRVNTVWLPKKKRKVLFYQETDKKDKIATPVWQMKH